MEKIKKQGLLIVFITLLCSCHSMRKNITPQANLKRIWMLTSFSTYSKEYLVQKKASLDLTATNAPAYMGCNRMAFVFKAERNAQIRFEQGISTKMACEDMSLESEFAMALTSITQYKVEGHQLTLLSGEGTKMTFIAADWD